jgi:hypothetical protein
VPRSADDIYVEFGFNIFVLKVLEPVMRQAEYGADEIGQRLSAVAGYEPAEQLRHMDREADDQTPPARVV